MNQIEDERSFLHDITSPLAIASGYLDIAIEEMKTNPTSATAQVKKLESALAAMARAKTLISDRRHKLAGDQTKESKN